MNERINNGILARLEAIETRLSFYDEDFEDLEDTTDSRFFQVNEALRSIDRHAYCYWDHREKLLREINCLKFTVEELEKKQVTQTRVNQVITRYIRDFGKNITRLIRLVFRLSNNIESDNPDLTTLDLWKHCRI